MLKGLERKTREELLNIIERQLNTIKRLEIRSGEQIYTEYAERIGNSFVQGDENYYHGGFG